MNYKKIMKATYSVHIARINLSKERTARPTKQQKRFELFEWYSKLWVQKIGS